MKSRRISLIGKILIPVLAAVLLIESGAYIGAVFVMNQAAYQDEVTFDDRVLTNIEDTIDVELLDGVLENARETYEQNYRAALPEAKSEEEKEYRALYEKAMKGQPYLQLHATFHQLAIGNYSALMGVFYEDTTNHRAVALLTNYLPESDDMPSTSVYVGYFFSLPEFMDATKFFGKTIVDPVYGKLFTSGHRRQAESGRRYWIINEVPENVVYSMWPEFSWRYAIVALGALILLGALSYFLIGKLLIQPIRKLSGNATAYADSIKNGAIRDCFSKSDAKISDEIHELNDSFYVAQEAISDYVKEIHDATEREQRIKTELDLAEKIQASMLPSSPLIGDDFAFHGLIKPAKEVGGDLYNFLSIDDDHVGFFIGDVSGKGVPAALFMTKANMILSHALKNLDISNANRLLCEGNTQNFFVTAFIGILELSTGKLRYVNCGHEPVFLIRNGRAIELEEEPNFALGFIDDFDFVKQETQLLPGDGLVLYTDGASEAMNPRGELYGKERILSTLNMTAPLFGEISLEALRENIGEFVGDAEQSDDMCLVRLDYGCRKELRFAPTMEGLALVAPFIDETLQSIDEESRAIIQVMFDELCSNVVFYSQTKEDPQLIIEQKGDEVVLTLSDKGIPFDSATDKPEHDPEKPGGLGIDMVHALNDGITYQRCGGFNVLKVVKRVLK